MTAVGRIGVVGHGARVGARKALLGMPRGRTYVGSSCSSGRLGVHVVPRVMTTKASDAESDAVGVATASEVTERKERKPSPLSQGGTLDGEKALGKDPAAATKAKKDGSLKNGTSEGNVFSDPRWVNGTWNLSEFKGADGQMDWDEVIDAEMDRRRILEETPAGTTNSNPVLFDTSVVPWWAWVRRFHLPEAEKLNGRAAMVGYFAALVVDGLSGAGIWDQQNSFFGKVLLNVVVIGVLFVRNVKDLEKFKNLFNEATFYDDQWNASWEGVERPEIEDE